MLPREERVIAPSKTLDHGFARLVARYGSWRCPDVPPLLEKIEARGLSIDLDAGHLLPRLEQLSRRCFGHGPLRERVRVPRAPKTRRARPSISCAAEPRRRASARRWSCKASEHRDRVDSVSKGGAAAHRSGATSNRTPAPSRSAHTFGAPPDRGVDHVQPIATRQHWCTGTDHSGIARPAARRRFRRCTPEHGDPALGVARGCRSDAARRSLAVRAPRTELLGGAHRGPSTRAGCRPSSTPRAARARRPEVGGRIRSEARARRCAGADTSSSTPRPVIPRARP